MSEPAGDDKNWTWVLERPCPECGFDAATIDRDQLGALIRANAAAWRGILSRGDIVSERPPVAAGSSPVWSALEYGAHVRDVYEVFSARITEMLKKDEPVFSDWNQDVAAVEGRYGEQDPGAVGYALAVTAGKLADILDRVSGDQWQRTGARSDGASFTVLSLATYMLHDVSHHVRDAENGFEAITEAD